MDFWYVGPPRHAAILNLEIGLEIGLHLVDRFVPGRPSLPTRRCLSGSVRWRGSMNPFDCGRPTFASGTRSPRAAGTARSGAGPRGRRTLDRPAAEDRLDPCVMLLGEGAGTLVVQDLQRRHGHLRSVEPPSAGHRCASSGQFGQVNAVLVQPYMCILDSIDGSISSATRKSRRINSIARGYTFQIFHGVSTWRFVVHVYGVGCFSGS